MKDLKKTKDIAIQKGFEDKAAELSITHKCKVTASWVKNDEEYIVAYMKEPDRLTKMQAIDMSMRSITQASDIILRASLIHDESDTRILDEKADDRIYLGFIMKAQEAVQFYSVQSKKN